MALVPMEHKPDFSWHGQTTVTGNGTYTVESLDNYSEVLVCFLYGNKIRQSIVFTKSYFEGGYAMPDIYIGGDRAYCMMSILGTTLTVTNFTTTLNCSWTIFFR